ncbi:MAG TPA: hypothetical protein VHX65_20455 [Pirellulales bacterium]|nr:hypothetical protein [Pirellulales bacterium]
MIGVLLSVVLCAWVWLMNSMHVNISWSVAPLPLVLLGATWLRAPDWATESRRWGARARAAAILLVPAIALLIAVPIYRTHQVPQVSPLAGNYWYVARIVPGVPCLWSSGPDLRVETVQDEPTGEPYGPDSSAPRSEAKLVDHFRNWRDIQFSRATVWQRGLWFPIPEQQR